MATEHFCLRWNNHQSTLVSVFDNLLESGTLVDCTLAADGRYLKAHKVVLSACSPYLGMLLSQHYDKHPIIILKDVKFDELKAMLDYMYRGEVNISQEQLSTFLKAAETLQIKGLTDTGNEEGNGLQSNRPPSSNSTTSANEDPQSPGPPREGVSSPGPRKRKRNKHGDEVPEGDSVSKISLSEGSDRLSGTSVGSPSGVKSASVKREPTDGDGEGQMSVDEGVDGVMSRPGPSNGGTNNKAPWILSADSSGEEMQLTPGQDGDQGGRKFEDWEIKREQIDTDTENVQTIEEKEIKEEAENCLEEPVNNLWSNQTNSSAHEIGMVHAGINGNSQFAVYRGNKRNEELIIPDPLESDTEIIGLPENYLQANFEHTQSSSTMQRDDLGTSNGQLSISEDKIACESLLKKGTLNMTPVEQSTLEKECMNRIEKECMNRIQQKVFVKPPTVSKSSKQHLMSGTMIEQSDKPLTRSISQPPFRPQKRSQSQLAISSVSKILDVADVFNEKQVKVKKTALDFRISKYRTILPAPGDNNTSKSKSNKIVQNVQPSNLPPFGKQNSTNPSVISHSQVQRGSSVQTCTTTTVQRDNTSSQQIQGGHISNTTATLLSISPQFTISPPVQTGNVQVHYSDKSSFQSGNYQNPQYFGTPDVISQNQLASSQNSLLNQQGQPVPHPVLVTSNLINPSQSLPPTSMTPANNQHSLYVRTPSGYVKVGLPTQVTQAVSKPPPFKSKDIHRNPVRASSHPRAIKPKPAPISQSDNAPK